jgi:hypothetical protein
MTNENIFIVAMPVMKSISLAVFILFTFGTLSCFRPTSVSEYAVFSLPYRKEVVCVNIALNKCSVIRLKITVNFLHSQGWL